MNKQRWLEYSAGLAIMFAAVMAAGLWNGLAFLILMGALAYDQSSR